MKQTSLFNFDSTQEEGKTLSEINTVITEETVPLIINEEPVDIEFTAAPVKKIINAEIKKSTRGRKKLSEGGLNADLIKVPEDDILFQKKYYAIGVVAEMFKVNISLIRFWEKEFDILKPLSIFVRQK